ncbi:UpxY family transcription antiterminator [Mangrovibacterium marinum]|uniref:Transcription antitermination factor NusG n=1 Tax=Mangrovibacterium marinum TaxID=1639118 RepID=A0A2T5C0F3_9BACT|nr:UpxY family transcription antiterminator [Mangrovibacterium marinum]PTN08003.1 transcription antitermination factor NusG [Mangrovibacterium marinum]
MTTHEGENKSWYAIYVKSRCEKKAWQKLTDKGIECYLPLHEKVRQWSDRKKKVTIPLLPGYLFVHIHPHEMNCTLQTDHVLCFITTAGKASVIRDEEIQTLKRILAPEELTIGLSAEAVAPGQQVEVIAGPLRGMQGELIQLKGKKVVGVHIRQIPYTITVDIPLAHLIVIPNQ